MRSPSLLLALCGLAVAGDYPSPPVYPSPPGQGKGQWESAYAKARELVGQMTVEEKVNITGGVDTADNVCPGNTGSVPRLGFPGMCLADAGNGVRATDFVNSYPSALHVGASWDKNLTYQRGLYMGKEFKTKGVNVLLGPNAGPLGRSPKGGRNWEGFSVDPYLSGVMNAESIVGHQEAGVIANIKHFIANEQETYRRPYHGVEAVSSNVDDRTLHEFYLWPFVDGVRAGVASVMCAYNRINGTYGCENSKLMSGVLKGELEFDGFTLLDWNAIHNLNSANAGLDMVMPTTGSFGGNLTDAVENGTVSESRLTDMATRILAAWYLVGQDQDFPQPGVGIQNLSLPHTPVEARVPESRPVILEGAVAGHVLVKNADKTLPFGRDGKPPKMLSVYGWDATVPASKNTDNLFELGYTSSPAMGQATLGDAEHFDQAARGGTIVTGGRAGANAPPYMIDPLAALQHRASKDMTWLNWELNNTAPGVNGATDHCLVFINAIATEGWDREGLRDEASDELVQNVASKCASTIVVIHAAGVRLVDTWIDHPNVTATIFAHLPGQDSGTALVHLLYGEENFSGKLPYTVAHKESDYGGVYDPCGWDEFPSSNGDGSEGPWENVNPDPQCDFTEGVYLDYRAFDRDGIEPRFEFGFGLSYTKFGYHDLEIKKTSNGKSDDDDLFDVLVTVTATISNDGDVYGSEAAQIYVGIPSDGDEETPIRQLRGFEKPRLAPGESRAVTFPLTRRDLSSWSTERQAWYIPAGSHRIWVGGSSRDLPLEGIVEVS